MAKPVPLIVTNRMHEAAQEIERALDSPFALARAAAVAQIASDSFVLKALAAAGGPATLAEVKQQFAAVRESRRESGLAPQVDTAPEAAAPERPS